MIREFNYIVVFDYTNERIVWWELTEKDHDLLLVDADHMLNIHGLDEDDCSWMLTHNKPNLEEIS